MKLQQKLFLKNIAALIMISVLLGNSAVVFGQVPPTIDGIYTDVRTTAEINRAIFVRPDTFGESVLIVGTNKGNAYFAKIKTDEKPLKQPAYKPFTFIQPTSSVVRDISFLSENNGYLLKSDGLYSSDGKSPSWKQILNVVKDSSFPQITGAFAELWNVSFVDNFRACIVGVYLKNTSDRDIDRELILCTNDISQSKIKWEEPNKPNNPKTEQLQFTNIYFDKKTQNGWAVGTDGAEGIIWYSENGGKDWEEQQVTIGEPLLGVFGINESKVFAVGYNGMVFGKGISTTKKPDTEIKKDDKVEIQSKIISKIPGISRIAIPTVTAKVEEIRNNKMLKVKVLEVIPEVVEKIVKKYFENNDVSPRDVKKVDNEDSDKSVSVEWNKIEVSSLMKPPTAALRSVKFADDGLNGFIVGDKGTILYTQDGGKVWKSLSNMQLATVDLYSIFVDGNYCWIAGSKGTIVRIKYKQ